MTKHTPATPLPPLARMAGEHDPFAILGAVVPRGAPMRALLQLHDDRAKLVEALRLCGERFAVIQKDVAPFERNVDYIKKIASEFADEARALLRSLGEE
jgi:hypothetical protein